MSTYNGARYLPEQLQSLLQQDYGDFRILVRDDGSTDETVDILRGYRARDPDRIFLDETLPGNIGVRRSFLHALARAQDGSCVMFCDQDDVWFANKISRFVARLQEAEETYGRSLPLIVFGDMLVGNQDMQVIDKSFWGYQSLDVHRASDWRRIMVSNVVTGCSSLLNPAAARLLQTAPDLPILHDHLAAIMVSRCGALIPLPEPTMLYRQHTGNVEGPRKFRLRYVVSNISRFTTVMVPRYRAVCRAFDVPAPVAIYLKLESSIRRLLLDAIR